MSHEAWISARERQLDRLKEPEYWFTVPAFISFVLIAILIGQIIPSVNPRLGNQVEVLSLDSGESKPGTIWFSIQPKDDELLVVTSERKIIHLPLQIKKLEEMHELSTYLTERVKESIVSNALQERVNPADTRAIIAVDQGLTYAHVRPIIFALAKAGISDYAFETKLVKVAHRAVGHKHGSF